MSCCIFSCLWNAGIILGGVYIFLLIGLRIYNKMKFKRCTSKAKLEGKTVIVTGSSAGIGKEAARDFAKRGAKVIMACRNREKAQRVADDIIETSGNKNVHVRILDTSLLASVRKFSEEILKQEDRLNILALNAGFGGNADKRITSEGLELTMATNHFGHFLLVNLLSELLLKSKPSRIVVTSSQAHTLVRSINPKDLNFDKETYSGQIMTYAKSKLCNVMMTKYLASHFQGKGVTANCFCPGFVATEIFSKSTGFANTLMTPFIPFSTKTEEEGAQTLIHLAVSEDVANISGEFFVDNELKKCNPLANDVGLAKKVWETSEDVVKLGPHERRLH